jgi:hypothetical protein
VIRGTIKNVILKKFTLSFAHLERHVNGPRVLILKFLTVVAAISLACPQGSLALTPDPMTLYGGELRFLILRNGKPVGSHVVQFQDRDRNVHVSAESKITVGFLGLPVYEFYYLSEATWLGERLLKLEATTDDNGVNRLVKLESNGISAWLSGPHGTRQVPADIIPTNHWHFPVINASQVLNTLTGNINAVTIHNFGWENVQVAGKTIRAQRYAYTGELQTDVWYDANGRWVHMKFNASDGSVIEYSCEGWSAMQPVNSD